MNKKLFEIMFVFHEIPVSLVYDEEKDIFEIENDKEEIVLTDIGDIDTLHAVMLGMLEGCKING
jgi:hypothetical protein